VLHMSGGIWIARDYLKCSGCRRCEIACSLHHEGEIWPESSRIRIFMLIPGLEVIHLCTQCPEYPCVKSCPSSALSIDEKTGAVIVDRGKCSGCGVCIKSCPGEIPHLHPGEGYVVICDLCGGDPQCVKVCREGGWNALWITGKEFFKNTFKLYARKPEEMTMDLLFNLYGDMVEV